LKRKFKALSMVAFVVDIDPSIEVSIKRSKIQGTPKTASTSKPPRDVRMCLFKWNSVRGDPLASAVGYQVRLE
jgi:hypothetical protein